MVLNFGLGTILGQIATDSFLTGFSLCKDFCDIQWGLCEAISLIPEPDNGLPDFYPASYLTCDMNTFFIHEIQNPQ